MTAIEKAIQRIEDRLEDDDESENCMACMGSQKARIKDLEILKEEAEKESKCDGHPSDDCSGNGEVEYPEPAPNCSDG